MVEEYSEPSIQLHKAIVGEPTSSRTLVEFTRMEFLKVRVPTRFSAEDIGFVHSNETGIVQYLRSSNFDENTVWYTPIGIKQLIGNLKNVFFSLSPFCYNDRHALKSRLLQLGHDLAENKFDEVLRHFKALAETKKCLTNEDIESLVCLEAI
ncbi:hypothetical protein ACFXTO_005126 [Malus domestica]